MSILNGVNGIENRAHKLNWDIPAMTGYARVLVRRRVENGELRVDSVDEEELVAEAVQAAWLHAPSVEDCEDDMLAQVWAVRSSVRSVCSRHWLAGCVVKRGMVREGGRYVELAAQTIEGDDLSLSDYKRFWRELRTVLAEFGFKNECLGTTANWRHRKALRKVCFAFAHDFNAERRIR